MGSSWARGRPGDDAWRSWHGCGDQGEVIDVRGDDVLAEAGSEERYVSIDHVGCAALAEEAPDGLPVVEWVDVEGSDESSQARLP